MQFQQPPRLNLQAEQPVAFVGREKPTEAAVTQGLIDLSQFLQGAILIARIGNREVVGVCESKRPTRPCPLVLKKWVDRNLGADR